MWLHFGFHVDKNLSWQIWSLNYALLLLVCKTDCGQLLCTHGIRMYARPQSVLMMNIIFLNNQ